MHRKEDKIFLDPKVAAQIDDACLRLGLTRSFFINVMFREMFQKARPEDIFFNRVRLCASEADAAEAAAVQTPACGPEKVLH